MITQLKSGEKILKDFFLEVELIPLRSNFKNLEISPNDRVALLFKANYTSFYSSI